MKGKTKVLERCLVSLGFGLKPEEQRKALELQSRELFEKDAAIVTNSFSTSTDRTYSTLTSFSHYCLNKKKEN